MRRFFIFAVLWAALFGSGHVLAACPMEPANGHAGTQAPCHSEQGSDASSLNQGHDCCSWLAPTGSSSKAFVQKGGWPVDDASGALPVSAAHPAAQSLIRPPPLIDSNQSSLAAPSGSGTFLRTRRLRL
jgi:hypothetical protein